MWSEGVDHVADPKKIPAEREAGRDLIVWYYHITYGYGV